MQVSRIIENNNVGIKWKWNLNFLVFIKFWQKVTARYYKNTFDHNLKLLVALAIKQS